MKIAMIGQRGVPATFGGIEHHVEHLGARLVARGHDVTVFCRSNYVDARPAQHLGMHLRHLPAIGMKHLEALGHSALSTAMALGGDFDIVHFHAIGPGVFAALPKALSHAGVVQTIHGMDHQRAKWGPVSRALLGAGVWSSTRIPDASIVVSRALAAHYQERYGRATTYIPNGVVAAEHRAPGLITEQFGLHGDDYVLFVGRLVPEKAPDLLIRAFRRLDTDVRLVIAGGSSYTDEYQARLRAEAKGRDVVFTGYVYGALLEELYANARAFVLPSYLEGLPLTLLEAAAAGVPVIASDIPPHQEVLGGSRPGGRLFRTGSSDDLAATLTVALDSPDERAGALELRSRVLREYSWDDAVEATESVYDRVLHRRAPAELVRSTT